MPTFCTAPTNVLGSEACYRISPFGMTRWTRISFGDTLLLPPFNHDLDVLPPLLDHLSSEKPHSYSPYV